jgi:hypothetical protein
MKQPGRRCVQILKDFGSFVVKVISDSKQFREANNAGKRRSDLMADIGKECSFDSLRVR